MVIEIFNPYRVHGKALSKGFLGHWVGWWISFRVATRQQDQERTIKALLVDIIEI